jgi:SAM-dependent methyltransferase
VLLDLGCGKAPLYGLYRHYTEDAICVDWANSIHANPHLDFVQDLNEPLATVDSQSVNTVLLSDTLEHIRRPQDLMNEIGRVLAPGGHLLMNVPFMYWLHEVPYDYYRFTRYGLEHLISEAGMRQIELEAIGGAPEVLGDVASKMVALVPKVGRAIASGIQAATAAAVRRGPGARASHRSREIFPLGYALVAAKAAS